MELVALHCDKSVLSRDAVMEARQSRLASPHPTLAFERETIQSAPFLL